MTIYTALHDWIVSVTGYTPENVIRGFQSGGRPTGDYAVYYILTTTSHDFSDTHRRDLMVDDDIEVQFIAPKEFVVSVDVYAPDGYQVLDNLGQSKELLATRDIFRSEQMALLGFGGAQSLTGLGDTEYRDRYNGAFTIGGYNETTEENQKILEVVMTGSLGGLGSVVEIP